MNDQTSRYSWRATKMFLGIAVGISGAVLCFNEASSLTEYPTSRYSLWVTGLLFFVGSGAWFRYALQRMLIERSEQIIIQHEMSNNASQGIQMGFLQTISDDVRGPLMSIVTNLRSMSLVNAQESKGDELSGLYKQGIRLQSRLNSALELGRSNLERDGQARPIDLSQLAADLAENYAQALLDKPHILLNLLIDHRLPKAIEAEPHRLMLLMGNLLENALGFSEQGQIVLKITTAKPNIAKGSEIELEISCSDCGLGISPERLERLSAELNDTAVTTAGTEVGLGLRAAMNITRFYKGSMEVVSKEGKGTTVTARLMLPVVEEARQWKQLPKSFRFCSTTQETYIALGNAGFFHGVTMVPIQDPTSQTDTETILVDGSDLVLQTWGPLDQFQPRDRYVIMLHKDQHRLREQLLTAGFSRFLCWPLVSTMLLKYLLDEDTPITARKQSVQSPQTESITILVVDDAETNRLRVCYHLRSAGYKVVEATDGLEVVAMIKSGSKFDLIITDLNMTHLNGDEALKQIRDIEATKGVHTPVVAISAYVDGDAEVKLKNAGFDAVLRKPVYLDELDFLVTSMIPEKSAPTSQTKLIDLDELRERSNGKTRLMAMLLDSFIQSSQSQLQDLRRGGPGMADKTTYLKTIHTLKGLLLEAGAKESAGYLNHVEKQARYTGVISMDEIDQIAQVINNVSEEAAALRDGLQQGV